MYQASAHRGLLQFLYFFLERTLRSAYPSPPLLSPPCPVHLFYYEAAQPSRVHRTASLRYDVTYRISGTLRNAAFMSF